MSRNRLMMLLAITASVVVALAGFFIGVAPQLTSTRASEEQRRSSEQDNVATQQRIGKLAEENKTLSQQQAQLAVLQGSIPATLDQSSFYSELTDLASTSGVTIASLTTSDAQAYAPPQSAGAGAPATPSASATPSSAATPSTPQAPVAKTNASITSANFSAVPVSVGVNGSFEQAIAYMKAVQSGKRLFLVTSIVSSSSSTSGSATKGSTGPTTWTLSGFIYVLQDAAATQAQQAAAAPAATPTPTATPAG